eukprot:COSAG04_NODE_3697_length_2598_cov_5.738695_2_plen_254_part_00
MDPKTGESSALAKAGAPPGDTANFLIKERATIDDIPKQIEGSLVSIISVSQVRYEGTLHSINSKEATISLACVRSFGLEGRAKGELQAAAESYVPEMMAAGYQAGMVVLQAGDIKDMQVIPPVPSLFTRFRPYLAHFPRVFSRFLRVFTASPRRFQRAPSRNPEPRNGGTRTKTRDANQRINWAMQVFKNEESVRKLTEGTVNAGLDTGQLPSQESQLTVGGMMVRPQIFLKEIENLNFFFLIKNLFFLGSAS